MLYYTAKQSVTSLKLFSDAVLRAAANIIIAIILVIIN